MDQATRLQPLGFQRNLVLGCLGGYSPSTPGYFLPAPTADIFDAFRTHVETLSTLYAGDSDPMLVSLLAAARLLTGALAAAEIILDRLPIAAPTTKFGPAYCPLLPVRTLGAVLPLPTDLKALVWIDGSAEQAAVRAWLRSNHGKLRWVEDQAVYRHTA